MNKPMGVRKMKRQLTAIGIASLYVAIHAVAQTNTPTHWTPPTSDPRDFEGVWLPSMGGNATGAPPPSSGGSPPADDKSARDNKNGPPPEIGGLGAPPPEGASAPGAAENTATGSTLACTPVQRLSGAGGGMSNLWIQGPNEIVMISEEDMDIRKIYLNAQHPKKFKPQPNGHSVGHWEGNTLVVDSIAFSKADGTDSGQHVVERITKQGNQLIDEATITDARGNSRQQTFKSSWRSDLHVFENVCEENFNRFFFKNGQLVDDTGVE